jgi:hypothetical protein
MSTGSTLRLRAKPRLNQFMEMKYHKVWQKVLPLLSHRDKYCIYNTSRLFRNHHREELTQVGYYSEITDIRHFRRHGLKSFSSL